MGYKHLTLFLAIWLIHIAGLEEEPPIHSLSLPSPTATAPPFTTNQNTWVDSVMNDLTLAEKVGQLIMLPAYSHKDSSHLQVLTRKIKQYHIGGLIFFQGTPHRQVRYTNHLQQAADIPLMVGLDAEWGLGMRLDSTISYPRQLMLGAMPDEKLLVRMGRQIAQQCQRIGVHINFAPVVDINTNPRNPVIHTRSFGENKQTVTDRALAYMQGLQQEGVLACAKHFPGHGDTDEDSHKTLPTVHGTRARLDSVELYPFRELIREGVGGVMNAHLYVPALDSTKNLPSSLSPAIVHQLLTQKMEFKGLKFTDALVMKGATKYYEPGKMAVKALQAGNDILLFPKDIKTTIDSVLRALKEGRLSRASLNKKVKKVLQFKYWSEGPSFSPIDTSHLYKDLHRPRYRVLKRQLIKKGLTLVRDPSNMIPIQRLDTTSIAVLTIGDSLSSFVARLKHYAPFERFHLSSSGPISPGLQDKLNRKDLILLGLGHITDQPESHFGISPALRQSLQTLNQDNRTIFTVFGTPYSLKHMGKPEGLLMAYQDDPLMQDLSAQLLFGGIQARGHLPVTASPTYTHNTGLSTPPPSRLQYTIPEEAGIHQQYLHPIDTLVRSAIDTKATPGCQILIARSNKVIFQKSYGYHTYDSIQPVRNSDLYDLASITKIASSTLGLMRLNDLGLIHLEEPLVNYMSSLKGTNKAHLSLRDILTHQAGMESWIPFYKKAIKIDESDTATLFSEDSSAQFPVKVSEQLYQKQHYVDTVWQEILDSPVKDSGEYIYSDLGFYLFKRLIERQTGVPLDSFVRTTFYQPLGLRTMGYLPLKRFPKSRIVPTEEDNYFRQHLLHGTVHDPGAAMLGGIGGHAGLFSNANDLAILMQMLLNYGQYGREFYLDPRTVLNFTAQQYKGNRKALGFDKPVQQPEKPNPAADSASWRAFGHSGFTGTTAWADPQYNLIYIFLSNRVHPSGQNRKLIDLNYRTRVHRVIYEALHKSKHFSPYPSRDEP